MNEGKGVQMMLALSLRTQSPRTLTHSLTRSLTPLFDRPPPCPAPLHPPARGQRTVKTPEILEGAGLDSEDKRLQGQMLVGLVKVMTAADPRFLFLTRVWFSDGFGFPTGVNL